MENKNKDCDFDEHKKIEEIKKTIITIKDLYYTNRFSDLEQLVIMQSRMLERTANAVKGKHEIPYQIGLLMGALDTMKDFIYFHNQQKEVFQTINSNKEFKISDIYRVCSVVSENPMIEHTNIGKDLMFHNTDLDKILEFMKKLEIIEVRTIGKLKYYTLSNVGVKVLEIFKIQFGGVQDD